MRKNQPGSGSTQLAEEILREYVEVEDVNQNEPVSLLPLTIIDMMEEYVERLNHVAWEDQLRLLRCQATTNNDIGIKVVVAKGEGSNQSIHEYENAMQKLVDKVVSEKHDNQDEPHSTDAQKETK